MGVTDALLAADRRHVWHPFTQHAWWPEDDPLVISRADGVRLYDDTGKDYIDGFSSLWVTVHGHNEPRINDAIARQAATLDHSTFLGFTHEPGVRLAEALVTRSPQPLTRVFFAGDGSSAVEAGIKMAYQAKMQQGQQRPLYVHVAQGYHGDTLGAVSVGGIDVFHHTYKPILLDTRMVSSPGLRRPGQAPADRAAEVLAELRALLDEVGETVCAIVVEPLVQAAAGMLTHDVSFLRGVRELSTEFGAYLLTDEVATGIGRTGAMWAVDHADIAPDLLTCGKGLTGGVLPLSAVLTTDEIYESFLGDASRTFFHGHSYTANPLCAAAALANLELMDERDTVAHAAWIGRTLGDLLKPLEADGRVLEIRRIGTMTGIEVVPNGERTGFRICTAAREHGVITRPLGDVVILMPPLGITEPDLQQLVAAIRHGMDSVYA
ncbi:MAG: adenosylmethionine--8-amino-7-oxononanoate transaminase [Actinobacteria bacterium]|nr:adenosylmethionine--8-amino-7-oxononanoate transaminase [Actinomycetota bacterium]MCB8997143.1 adenosylmethionine--8-amino-7-oxononanoate transaminase [Actinomycetota bacterium]